MDSTRLILFLTVQAFIAIAAGEVTIRYASWYFSIIGKKIALAPLIMGIAITASGLCAMEIEWMYGELVQSIQSPDLPIHGPIDYLEGILIRVWVFLGICSLTLPVLLLQGGDKQDKRTMFTDMLIRLFIIIAAFAAGVNATVIYVNLFRHY